MHLRTNQTLGSCRFSKVKYTTLQLRTQPECLYDLDSSSSKAYYTIHTIVKIANYRIHHSDTLPPSPINVFKALSLISHTLMLELNLSCSQNPLLKFNVCTGLWRQHTPSYMQQLLIVINGWTMVEKIGEPGTRIPMSLAWPFSFLTFNSA